MDQDAKELDVPWLKIMHAGFNVALACSLALY